MVNKAFIDLAINCIFPHIKSGEFLPKNCTYGAVMNKVDYADGQYSGPHSTQDLLKAKVGGAFGDPAKLDIWKEVHGVDSLAVPGALDQALSWWGRILPGPNVIRIGLSNDGSPIKETTPCAAIIKRCRFYGNDFFFEHLPEDGGIEAQVPKIKEMYKAIHGLNPMPHYHYEPPSPPLPPPPPPPPPDPELEPQSCYEKYIAGRPFWKWQLGKFIGCLFGKD